MIIFVPASPASLAAFLAIVIAIIGSFLAAVARVYRADPHRARHMAVTVIAVGLWIGGFAGLVVSGRMTTLPLSGLPFFAGGVLLTCIGVGASPLGTRLASGLSLAALVGFQAFRFPLELVLHAWAAGGTIPSSMTWDGKNWDILSGLLALVAAPWANRHRAVAWVFNGVGAVLLVNVMRVAVLSSPVPFGWGVTPPLVLAFHLPYALIGPVCIGGALLGHIVLTRALLRSAPRSSSISTKPSDSEAFER